MAVRSRIITVLAFGAVLAAAVPAMALQCVPYAREASGISLRGDAWTWWGSAAGVYDRGHGPRVGAVVVFKRHGSMRRGHVAVVTEIINSREVLVDHANWGSRRLGGRGKVAKGMAVVDISPENDWTEVRVWNRRLDDYGSRVYPTYGFIYAPGSQSARYQQASFVPDLPRGVSAESEPDATTDAAPVESHAGRHHHGHHAVVRHERRAPHHARELATEAAPPVPPAKPALSRRMAARLVAMAHLPAKPEIGAARRDLSEHQGLAGRLAEEKGAADHAPQTQVDTDDQALARRFGAGHY